MSSEAEDAPDEARKGKTKRKARTRRMLLKENKSAKSGGGNES